MSTPEKAAPEEREGSYYLVGTPIPMSTDISIGADGKTSKRWIVKDHQHHLLYFQKLNLKNARKFIDKKKEEAMERVNALRRKTEPKG